MYSSNQGSPNVGNPTAPNIHQGGSKLAEIYTHKPQTIGLKNNVPDPGSGMKLAGRR